MKTTDSGYQKSKIKNQMSNIGSQYSPINNPSFSSSLQIYFDFNCRFIIFAGLEELNFGTQNRGAER